MTTDSEELLVPWHLIVVLLSDAYVVQAYELVLLVVLLVKPSLMVSCFGYPFPVTTLSFLGLVLHLISQFGQLVLGPH